jgi:hypothetical protein
MATSCSPTCQQYPLVPMSAAFHVIGRGAAVDGQINFVNTAASRQPSDNVKGAKGFYYQQIFAYVLFCSQRENTTNYTFLLEGITVLGIFKQGWKKPGFFF